MFGSTQKIVCLLLMGITSSFSWGTRITDSLYSSALDQVMPLEIFLPEGYNQTDSTTRYPVIYKLHYFHGNYTTGGMELEGELMSGAAIQPVIIVKPQAYVDPFVGAWWINSEFHGNYEEYLGVDIVSFIDSAYMTIANKDCRALFGISMGGYGSMINGLKYPDRFSSVASLSGTPMSFNWLEQRGQEEILPENGGQGPFDPTTGHATELAFSWAAVFSPNPSNEPYGVDLPFDNQGNIIDSIYALWEQGTAAYWASQSSPDLDLDIYFNVGNVDAGYSEQYYLQGNSALSDTFNALGISHRFEIWNCGHVQQWDQRKAVCYAFLDSSLYDGIPMVTEMKVSPHYVDLIDPVVTITSDVMNLQAILITVECIIREQGVGDVDTISLFDDGTHGDIEAGDNVWSTEWNVPAYSGFWSANVRTIEIENEIKHPSALVDRFTTSGPLEFINITSSNDDYPNPNDSYMFNCSVWSQTNSVHLI